MRVLVAIAISSAILLCATHAQAGVIMHHQGANDPETEGWSKRWNWVNLVTGPIYDDQGTGIDAWMIEDSAGATGEYMGHTAWTPEAEAAAWENGWTARWELRIADIPHDQGYSTPYFAVGFDPEIYNARWGGVLGTDASGENFRMKRTGFADWVTVPGVGYHLVELVFDPTTKTVDFFIDGTELFSNVAAYANSVGESEFVGVTFGSRHTSASSTTHYSLVELDVVDYHLPVILPGDANKDGKVDETDAATLAGNWLTMTDATWEMGDFSGDGKVDEIDATMMATNWGYGLTAAAAEPGIMSLLIGVLSLIIYRFR